MRAFETGRSDIEVTTAGKIVEGKPIRISLIGQYGDETVKALTTDQAIDLARALLTAAKMPSPYAF